MAGPSVPHSLAVAHGQVREEIQRADAKATTLLSLVGAALAGVIALSTRTVPVPAAVALWCSVAPILSSVLVLLSAIRPRLNTDPVAGTWLHAAQVGASALLESYQDDGESTVSAAHDVCVLARIARAKYVRIQHAVALLVVGLAALTVALVLSVVA
jgi:hypothetical protein